jgi:hypothetical protein
MTEKLLVLGRRRLTAVTSFHLRGQTLVFSMEEAKIKEKSIDYKSHLAEY